MSFQNPAHVRPPEPVAWRMRIAIAFGVGVMNAMRRHPGHGTAFYCQCSAQSQTILYPLRRFETAMRQQPVIANADAQAARYPPQKGRNDERRPAKIEERRNRAHMKRDQEQRHAPVKSA